MSEKIPTKTGKKVGEWYDNFSGFQKLVEIRDFIPRFKDFYYEKKLENPNTSVLKIINDFNIAITPDKFHPYTAQYRRWRKYWDSEISDKLLGMKLKTVEVKAIKTRDENNNLIAPSENELEDGAKNLAGELMNDAMMMLKNDQQLEELYDDEIIVKRRHYVLNVFNFVMRAVHTKQALAIKANAEKRETTGFLMDLVRRSTAGKITSEEMSLLKQSFGRAKNEQPMANIS